MNVYPHQSLPRVVRDAVEEIAERIKAPISLIATCCVSAIAAAAQAGTKVKNPLIDNDRPVGLFVVVIAESGERKSTVDHLVFKPLLEADKARAKVYADELSQSKAKLVIWKSGARQLMKKLVKADASEKHLIEKEISDHYATEPTEPRLRGVIKKDLSQRAFVDALEGTGTTFALLCDEGGTALRSEIFTQPSVLNSAWDGGVQQLDRADGICVCANDSRLSISLMVQPGVFDDYKRRHGGCARASGLFARFLVTQPESTQGSRYVNEVDSRNSWPCLDRFHLELQRLLEESSDGKPIVCRLDDDALSQWVQMVNYFETQMNPQNYCADIKDFTSKAGEMVLRIAALFHRISGHEGLISSDTLMRAYGIVCYHIEEFKRQFSLEHARSDALSDAHQLTDYIRRAYCSQGLMEVDRNTVFRHGPIRQKNRFNDALEVMLQNRVCEQSVTRTRRRVLRLNLGYFQLNLQAGVVSQFACQKLFSL